MDCGITLREDSTESILRMADAIMAHSREDAGMARLISIQIWIYIGRTLVKWSRYVISMIDRIEVDF